MVKIQSNDWPYVTKYISKGYSVWNTGRNKKWDLGIEFKKWGPAKGISKSIVLKTKGANKKILLAWVEVINLKVETNWEITFIKDV